MFNTGFKPFDMATHGLLSNNSFTISIQGHLTIIEITPVPPSILNRFGGSYIESVFNPKDKKKKKYKIKVTIIKDGKKYIEEQEVKSLNPPTISDIKIGFEENTNKVMVEILNPQISISSPKISIKFWKS